MKVRMVQQMSGPRGDGTDWPAFGAEIDVSDEEGRDLCAGGIAIPVAEERAAETAHVPDARVELRGEPEPEVPAKRGPGRPPGSTNKPK